jgi:hypothetical protein
MHQTCQKLYVPRIFLNLFNKHGVSYGLYQVPLLLSLSLKKEIRPRMKIFGYTKCQLALLNWLSYIKKYLTRIFR